MNYELTSEEARVLGVLIEKQLATPEYYPMTLKGLIAGCNQKTGRDPVTQFDDDTVMDALDALRQKGLSLRITEGAGRVPKHKHNAMDELGLDRPRLAALALLLLRGPQTLGEIRSRAARMHEFDSLGDAEDAMRKLETRPETPLIRKLERRPGQKEARFMHLLSGDAAVEMADVSPQPSRMSETPSRIDELEEGVQALREEVAELRKLVDEMRGRLM